MSEGEFMAKIVKKKIKYESTISIRSSWSKNCKKCCVKPFSTINNNVEIGEGTWVGSNVSIMEGARIGKNCYISWNSHLC